MDFEILFTYPAAGADLNKGTSLGPSYDPQIRLPLLDIQTHVVLWAITEHAHTALRESNRDENFDVAMNELVMNLKSLAEPPNAAKP